MAVNSAILAGESAILARKEPFWKGKRAILEKKSHFGEE